MGENTGTMKVLKVFFLAVITFYAYFYFTRHEHFLDWELVSSLSSNAITHSSFSKGPFDLNIVGEKYLVEENFVGSEL